MLAIEDRSGTYTSAAIQFLTFEFFPGSFHFRNFSDTCPGFGMLHILSARSARFSSSSILGIESRTMPRIEWQMSFRILLRERLGLPVAFSRRILCHSPLTDSFVLAGYTYHAVSRCEIQYYKKFDSSFSELNSKSNSSKFYSQLVDIFLCN